MRILYIITKSNWGGAQRHVFDLATAVKERGHDVWVALGGDGILKQKLEASGIYCFSISSLGRDIDATNDWKAFWNIFSIIREKKPDVLHLHSTKAIAMGSLAGRLLRVKKIYSTVHGWPFNEPRPIWFKLGLIFASWISILFCHKTIVLSRRELEQGLKFPWVKDKFIVIAPGIKPLQLLSIAGANQLLSKLVNADLSKKVVIGTIAELHKNKGLRYLVEAINSLKEIHPNVLCIIIGDGEEREALQNLVAKYKVEEFIKFTGHIDNASEYLKAFNIFVLPSLKEGLPYTILEAGLASLPVISTTVGGIPEVIEDMKSGILIQPKKFRELAHAISFMIENQSERRLYASALREKVKDNFSFEKMFSETEKLYIN